MSQCSELNRGFVFSDVLKVTEDHYERIDLQLYVNDIALVAGQCLFDFI